MIKEMLPRSLLGRSLLIIVTPLVLLQVISAFVFYEGHWDKVSRRLALGLAGDIGTLSEIMRRYPGEENLSWVETLASIKMGLELTFENGQVLPNRPEVTLGVEIGENLLDALDERVKLPYQVEQVDEGQYVIVRVQLPDGVMTITTQRKRLFSSTTYIFVLWMVGTSLILFGLATVFMRNQVRPIRRLARAADAFGKRQNVDKFKPEGAAEVRQAAEAFLVMKERIERQISQRTEMLAGVSHDLKTPLTRMKLQLAMMAQDPNAEGLKEDVGEMEHMLEEYLAFARGEGGEKPVECNVTDLVHQIVLKAKRKGALVDYHSEGVITHSIRPNAFSRCVTNVIDNATRYGTHVSVRLGVRNDAVEITVDDDGPGIPKQSREEVFKPFFRLEASRNLHTGGVGLGLSIVRDVVRGHGGEIDLLDSPQGGLRARLHFPL